jgi:transcription initiation factor TFIID subunit 1
VQYDLGVPFVLELQDESPFMKFGYVYPGQTIPAMYNNLIRAPLFRHKPYNTDFLVVRYDNFQLFIDLLKAFKPYIS